MAADWSKKVILITGASSGIGRGLATELARRGGAVGLLARRESALRMIAKEIEDAGGRALALPADVTDGKAVGAAASELAGKFGGIDVLIANAGIAGRAGSTSATDLDPSEVEEVLRVNVLGAVNAVAAVLPAMTARGSGQLVGISSLAAYRGLPKSGAYCASKAALSVFFESVRLDLTGTGVEVTIIHPGFIKTPLTAGRHAQMPFLMELEDGVEKILHAIETHRRSYAFPWTLAAIVRAGMLMPAALYDRIALRNSFRE
jgi:short-subunit dehydrogenase